MGYSYQHNLHLCYGFKSFSTCHMRLFSWVLLHTPTLLSRYSIDFTVITSDDEESGRSLQPLHPWQGGKFCFSQRISCLAFSSALLRQITKGGIPLGLQQQKTGLTITLFGEINGFFASAVTCCLNELFSIGASARMLMCPSWQSSGVIISPKCVQFKCKNWTETQSEYYLHKDADLLCFSTITIAELVSSFLPYRLYYYFQ